MSAPQFPTSGSYYTYRGETYRAVSTSADWVGLPIDEESSSTRFPDAIEQVVDRYGRWVKVPRYALDAAFSRRVSGTWRGVPVRVVSVILSGSRRGKVAIEYIGADPSEAIAAGMSGDQYNGWGVAADPFEVEVLADEMVPRPVVER